MNFKAEKDVSNKEESNDKGVEGNLINSSKN